MAKTEVPLPVKISVIKVKMSGKVGDSFYCASCDIKFESATDYETHCSGKKHRALERVIGEKQAADCSIVVRGLKRCENAAQFLASYFCKFGLLANVSVLGADKAGKFRVQFAESSAVTKVIGVGSTHEHSGRKLEVSLFEYKPQFGDAARLAHQEDVRKEATNKSDLHMHVCRSLAPAGSLDEQMKVLTQLLGLTQEDLSEREQIAHQLEKLFAPKHPGCKVQLFGSSINGFGRKGCDLDIFLWLDSPEQPNSKSQMKGLSKVLCGQHVSDIYGDVYVVPSIRCPIIKFTHKPTGLKCDLSVDNKKGLHNSRLLRLYSTLPPVRELVFALRVWAKFRGLSGGVTGPSCLSSYALTLIAIFYLMRQKLVPTVWELLDCLDSKGVKIETVDDCKCLVVPENAKLPVSKDFPSSAELLKGLFQYYTEQIDWEVDALTVKDALIVPRASMVKHFSYQKCRIGSMTVVDPFNLSHNVAGNVNPQFRQRLDDELKRAAQLSAKWPSGNSPLSDHAGLVELFTEVELEKSPGKASKKNKKGKKKKSDSPNGKTASPPVAKPLLMEGEQENGEFHIILPVSEATLRDPEMISAAKDMDISDELSWLDMAKNFTVNVLESVFHAEMDKVPGEIGSSQQARGAGGGEEENKKPQTLRKKRSSGEAGVDEDDGEKPSPDEKPVVSLNLSGDMPVKKLCDGISSIAAASSAPITATTTTTTMASSIVSIPTTTTLPSTATTNSVICSSASITTTFTSVTSIAHAVTTSSANISTVVSSVTPPTTTATDSQSVKDEDELMETDSPRMDSTETSSTCGSKAASLVDTSFSSLGENASKETSPDTNENTSVDSTKRAACISSSDSSKSQAPNTKKETTPKTNKNSNSSSDTEPQRTLSSTTKSTSLYTTTTTDGKTNHNTAVRQINSRKGLPNPNPPNTSPTLDKTNTPETSPAPDKSKPPNTSPAPGQNQHLKEQESRPEIRLPKKSSPAPDNDDRKRPKRKQFPPSGRAVLSLVCRCRGQAWLGRKKLRRELVLQAHPAACCGSGLALEREISRRSLAEQARSAAVRAAVNTGASEKDRGGAVRGDSANKEQDKSVATRGDSGNNKEQQKPKVECDSKSAALKNGGKSNGGKKSPGDVKTPASAKAAREVKPDVGTTKNPTSDGSNKDNDNKPLKDGGNIGKGIGEKARKESDVASEKSQGNVILEFYCDIVLYKGNYSGGEGCVADKPASLPYVLIKLKPVKKYQGMFRVFYDPFRSIMQRLNVSDLNV